MKIAFVCKENACRSQIAEALAGKIWGQSGVEFVSAGTHPASTIAPLALEVLQEEGIPWQGKPKSFDQIGQPDGLVTMGCDVVCPYIPGVRTVEWDISDPRGKAIEEYRQVAQMIRKQLLELRQTSEISKTSDSKRNPNKGDEHHGNLESRPECPASGP